MKDIEISIVEENNDVYFILIRKGKNTTYTGRIARLGNVTHYFARRFDLSTKESHELQHRILKAYYQWNSKKRVPNIATRSQTTQTRKEGKNS